MTSTPATRVASLNMRNTATPFRITTEQAAAGLRAVLFAFGTGRDAVDLIGLQEWAGSARDGILRTMGTVTLFPTMRRWLPFVAPQKNATGYAWVRPALGGPVVGARADRYVPRFVRSHTLAPAGRLERIPGFRSLLGASKVTVAGFRDVKAGHLVVLINGHLTRHVEAGGRYRTDEPKTVARHKREVTELGKVIAFHHRRGRQVFVTVDGNFDGLEIPPLTSCWEGHPKSQTGGTLGSRRVDIVFADDLADSVKIIPSKSDHRHPIATYR